MTDTKAIQEEIWKEIVGWEGYYEVSSNGRIRSLYRVIMRSNGRPQTEKPRLRKTYLSRGKTLVILRRNDKPHGFIVSRLVAHAFIGDPMGMHVNHIDGNPLNDHLSNLEIVSPRENTNHYYSNRKNRVLPTGVGKTKNGYYAQARIKEKLFYLGAFSTPEQANKAYVDFVSGIGEGKYSNGN